MKKYKHVDHVSFSFDHLHILAVFDNNVHWRGYYSLNENEDHIECVLCASRDRFNNIFKEYLDRKGEICKSYGHYCGVGDVLMNEFEVISETNLLTGFDENKGEYGECIYSDVPVILVKEFMVDLEHG